MRIVLFDGILETHVHESLARALRARGHEVSATGRIGQGFRFPARGADTAHLERAVDQAIAFAPDWLLCLRPASLPPRLLRRLRAAGIRLVAWFSDDPVLFDLSYGPVVELYDRIAHCGSATVLEHYERFFGRPTGVNLPFWTDHSAFPYVWGTEPPETEVMFLGNVHDRVRRRRYFELARLGPRVRVHGRVGADHFHLGGGYLDSSAEIVAAGARTLWSLSIPQLFSDHRGSATWFPGMDELGWFELPSRVVQAMAMGIPTISVQPEAKAVTAYPELLVTRSVDEAREVMSDASWTPSRLASLSRAVLDRFDRHFSADARARALERFLTDDGWMELDANGRASWFATAADAVQSTATNSAPEGRGAPIGQGGRASTLPSRVVLAVPRHSAPTDLGPVLGASLDQLGIPVTMLETSDGRTWVSLDQAGRRGAAGTVLIVEDRVDGLPPENYSLAEERHVVVGSAAPSRREAPSSPFAVTFFQRAPGTLLSPEFLAGLPGRPAQRVLRISDGPAHEDDAVQGLSDMLDAAGFDAISWSELEQLPLRRLAEVCSIAAAVIVPRTAGGTPSMDGLLAHVLHATDLPLMPRSPQAIMWKPSEQACLFATVEELGRKAWRLDSSPSLRAALRRTSASLELECSPLSLLEQILVQPSAQENERAKPR